MVVSGDLFQRSMRRDLTYELLVFWTFHDIFVEDKSEKFLGIGPAANHALLRCYE